MKIIDFIIERLIGAVSILWLVTTFPVVFIWMMIIVLVMEIKDIVEYKRDCKKGS